MIELDWRGTSCGFAAHIAMYQPDIEDTIDQHVRATGSVEVNQGWVVVNVRPHDDSVEITTRPWTRSRIAQWAHGNEERTIAARYLIGADGANSFVRATLGIERSDLGVNDRWLKPRLRTTTAAARAVRPAHPILRPGPRSRVHAHRQESATLRTRRSTRRGPRRARRPGLRLALARWAA